MATPGEKVFVVLDHHDREEAFEVTQEVNDMMSLVQLLTPDLPPALTRSMREAAIVRVAERVVRTQAERGDISSFTGVWYTSRVPLSADAASPSVMSPSLEEAP